LPDARAGFAVSACSYPQDRAYLAPLSEKRSVRIGAATYDL
jgi:hypothetical protein